MHYQTEDLTTAYGISDMHAREIIAANLRALMDSRKEFNSTPAMERATAARGLKVGHSTVDRILNKTTAVNIDTLESIARVFGLDVWQLLVPNLVPKNPPLIKSVGETEDKLYRRLDKLVGEIADLRKP